MYSYINSNFWPDRICCFRQACRTAGAEQAKVVSTVKHLITKLSMRNPYLKRGLNLAIWRSPPAQQRLLILITIYICTVNFLHVFQSLCFIVYFKLNRSFNSQYLFLPGTVLEKRYGANCTVNFKDFTLSAFSRKWNFENRISFEMVAPWIWNLNYN